MADVMGTSSRLKFVIEDIKETSDEEVPLKKHGALEVLEKKVVLSG